MSGLVGFCDFTKKSSRYHLIAMMKPLLRRGPDDEGNQFFQLDKFNLGFGHKRLAIIDLSENGRQPMLSPDGNYMIVFDGRIYNADEIRNELIKAGFGFRSNTHAEVVLTAFFHWGTKSVDRLNGMFAFVIYSKLERKIYLVRDRYGVKPIFYYWRNGLLLFSSELKAFYQHPGFIKEVDQDAVASYFLYGGRGIPSPNSIFKKVYKVNPGHFIEFDLKAVSWSEHKYWSVIDYYNKPKLHICEEDAEEELERLLVLSIRSSVVSDVPVGAHLSGGYDSSFISAVIQQNTNHKLKTFCIGFEDSKFNEFSHAKEVSEYLGTEHINYYCTATDALNSIIKLPEIYNEPHSISSIIPATLISHLVKQHAGVALAGDGIGFARGPGNINKHLGPFNLFYHMLSMPNLFQEFLFLCFKAYSRLPVLGNKWRAKAGIIKNMINAHSIDRIIDLKYMGSQNIFNEEDIDRLLNFSFSRQQGYYHDVNKINLTGSLEDQVDRLVSSMWEVSRSLESGIMRAEGASSYDSLETRYPLVDRRVIEYIVRLPVKFKNDKYLYKKIVKKYIPNEIIEKPKQGLGSPIIQLINKERRIWDLVDYYTSGSSLIKNGYFNATYVENLKKRRLSSNISLNEKKAVAKKLWQVACFQMWYERWV